MSNLRLAIYLTRSLLHIGAGQALGDTDLPVSRQITTQHPNLPASAQKRALKDALGIADPISERVPMHADQLRALFGADATTADADADLVAPVDAKAVEPNLPLRPGATGMLTPQDGELLLLPVACGAGGGAWITSPSVWLRFRRDAALAGLQAPRLPGSPGTDQALCPVGSAVVTQLGGQVNAWVQLGPVALAQKTPDATDAWDAWTDWLAQLAFGADDGDWQALVRQRLIIVSDTVFDRLLPLALVNRARNKIGTTGVAENLWREEAVPDDTVFHALVGAQTLASHHQVFGTPAAALGHLADALGDGGLPLMIGGKASIGQGFMLLRLPKPVAPLPPVTAPEPAAVCVEPQHGG